MMCFTFLNIKKLIRLYIIYLCADCYTHESYVLSVVMSSVMRVYVLTSKFNSFNNFPFELKLTGY